MERWIGSRSAYLILSSWQVKKPAQSCFFLTVLAILLKVI